MKLNKKAIKEYADFISKDMDKEYKKTLEELKTKFVFLDKKVVKIAIDEELELEEKMTTILQIIENYKSELETMLNSKMEKIIENKRVMVVEKINEIVTKEDDVLVSLLMIEPLMDITKMAYDTYIEVCNDYINDRILLLMDTVEEYLGIKEEVVFFGCECECEDEEDEDEVGEEEIVNLLLNLLGE